MFPAYAATTQPRVDETKLAVPAWLQNDSYMLNAVAVQEKQSNSYQISKSSPLHLQTEDLKQGQTLAKYLSPDGATDSNGPNNDNAKLDKERIRKKSNNKKSKSYKKKSHLRSRSSSGSSCSSADGRSSQSLTRSRSRERTKLRVDASQIKTHKSKTKKAQHRSHHSSDEEHKPLSRKKQLKRKDQSPSTEPKKRKKAKYDTYSSSGGEEKHSKSKKQKKKKSKHKTKHRQCRKYGRDADTVLPHLPNKVFIEDVPNLTAEHAYRIDRTRDENNFAYSSLYSENIAKRRSLVKVCLGKYKGKDVWLKEKAKYSQEKSRYYIKEYAKQSNQPSIKCYQTCELSRHEDFVHIGNASMEAKNESDRSLRSYVNPLGIYDSGTELWLQGKGKDVFSTEPQIDKIDTIVTESDIAESKIRSKMADYNRLLTKEPNNIDLWLEFAELQDNSTHLGKVERNIGDVAHNKPLKRSVAEIKMAVFEKALEKNPQCMRLKLAQLELGQDFWDTEKLLKEWNSLLFKHPNSGPLWLKYLEFRLHWSSGYTVSSVSKAFEKAIKTLESLINGEMKSHTLLANTEEYMITIFAEMCKLYRDAGHQEKAIALYQAMLEYNVFFPSVLDEASSSDTQEFFEAFWEGNCPRVGENEAVGWSTWVERKGQVDTGAFLYSAATDEEIESVVVESNSYDIHRTWVSMEKSRNNRHWLPWRANLNIGETDDDCEDPDRGVLSDDVISSLFRLTNEKNRFLLSCHFLHFLGVTDGNPVSSCNETRNGIISWSDEIFSRETVNSNKLLQLTKDSFSDLENLECFVCNLFEQIIPGFNGLKIYGTLLKKMYMRFRLIVGINRGFSSKEWKNLRKWAKSLMKEESNRTDLTLWAEFAYMEWVFKHDDDALKVTAVTVSSLIGCVADMSDNRMKTELCWLYLQSVQQQIRLCAVNFSNIKPLYGNHNALEGDQNYACYILYSLATGERFPEKSDKRYLNPLLVSKCLKGRRLFAKQVTVLIDKDSATNVLYDEEDCLLIRCCGSMLVHWVTCSAYFSYITEDFKSAVDIFTSTLESIKPVEVQLCHQDENVFNPNLQYKYLQYLKLYENYISLCKYHTDNVATAPLKLLRQPLEIAMEDIPNHKIFLEMYVQVETQASVSMRLRQYFRQTVSNFSGNAIKWLYAILAEMLKKQKIDKYEIDNISNNVGHLKDTGITHQMRAWFERATSHPVARQSVLLWRIYALFEIEQQHMAEAKAVYYQALSHCPGSKGLYTDMAEYFPELLTEVTDMMLERELRLRTPLEELHLLCKKSDSGEDNATVEDGAKASNTEEKYSEDIDAGEGSGGTCENTLVEDE